MGGWGKIGKIKIVNQVNLMMLKISNLNVHYGESHILRNVDLTVLPGQMVCLIGRNGVGKTTMLKTIMGLLKPSSGIINF
ncbi:ATP-binding cassette domain-containing protein, partial [Dolichospermum circinale CS-537/05]|nr:ATP-binding cassette domain-containing protein [Dolichospermum circinale CS-537/05]